MIPATAVDRFLHRLIPHEGGVASLPDIPVEAGNATHPLARPVVRLPLSLLLAYRGSLRRRFVADTRPNAPSGASDYGC